VLIWKVDISFSRQRNWCRKWLSHHFSGVLGYCKLPPYDEIIRVPPTTTPPPPYTSRRQSIHQLACLQPNANGYVSVIGK